VLSLDVAQQKPPPAGISCDLAEKIRIDEAFIATKSYSPAKASYKLKKEPSSQDFGEVAVQSTQSLLTPSLGEHLNKLPASIPSSVCARKESHQIIASLPLLPMQRVTHEPPCNNPFVSTSAPPYLSTPLSPVQNRPPSVASYPRAHHILSQSGTDLFHITISKLHLSFTTKIATDQSCKYEVDHFLPSMLIEKGRLSIDQFNTFMHEKTKSGKWVIAHIKLSSIEGNANMSCYKKFYKEYESLGKLSMMQVSDTTKLFLVTPKFLRVSKCLRSVENISRSCTYAVVLTKDRLATKRN